MSMPASSSIVKPAASPFIHPLDEFYAQASLPLPEIETIPGPEMPQPFRQLLVHQNDMTPTLSGFYSDKIHLRVLRRQQRDDFYCRQVLLLLDASDRPIEFGAIKINLALFPPSARRPILEERIPLGQILSDHRIVHQSRPKAYLRLRPDAYMAQILKLRGHEVLYGRRNTISDSVQRPLAEIVEILPPA